MHVQTNWTAQHLHSSAVRLAHVALTKQVLRRLFYVPVFYWQSCPRLMLKTNKNMPKYNILNSVPFLIYYM